MADLWQSINKEAHNLVTHHFSCFVIGSKVDNEINLKYLTQKRKTNDAMLLKNKIKNIAAAI